MRRQASWIDAGGIDMLLTTFCMERVACVSVSRDKQRITIGLQRATDGKPLNNIYFVDTFAANVLVNISERRKNWNVIERQ
jgi:hypothetical protein